MARREKQRNKKSRLTIKQRSARRKGQFVFQNRVRFEATPEGLFYSPKKTGPSKHDCPDCFHCQWCADVRCDECRGAAKCQPNEHS